MHRPNLHLALPLLLLLAFFGLGGWYLDARRSSERNTLSGFFESQPTEVSSRLGGRVARILVNEGDTVRAGQPLVVLEATPAREDTAAREAAAEQARQALRETVNGPRPQDIRKQEEAVAEAEANLDRLRNGPLPEEIHQARARLEQAEAQYRKALAGSRPQEIEEARAAERNARAHLAQMQRGLTPEEKAEAKARLDAADTQLDLARKDAARYALLYQDGAISRQQYDQSQANLHDAEAKRREQAEAWKRAEEGTPPEELEQARQSYLQAKAALALVAAGSRPEDIEAARASAAEARQALRLLERGARREDIEAAQARLAQARVALAELRAGNRREQIAQSRAAAQSARDTARGAQANLAERIVRAPESGVVERIPVAIGDLVASGAMVVRMSDPNNIWLRIYVPEAELAQVRVGSGAELRVDGVPGPVAAYVESVATQGEFTPANLQSPEERGKQVFAVRLRLRHPDPRIKAGMYVTVTRIGGWVP